LVFVLQTNSNSVGSLGGGIGYSGVPNSVGIEFDTWFNGSGFGDPDGNHVAINTEGDLNPNFGVASVPTRMNDGDLWYAWVDYNGGTNELEVRLDDSSTRPVAPLLSAVLDLPTILGSTNAFVGFTSGTGSAYGDHDIESWVFRDNYEPIVTPPNGVPEGGNAWAIFGLALGTIALMRRKMIRTRAA
jgi:hypothetical protein